MRNFKFKNAMMIIAAVLIFAACEKDETENDDAVALEAVTTLVDATSYSDWVYYSFTENNIIEVTDPATSTSWDIGLMRNHFKTNSGSSGSGEGGAFDAGVVDFDTYIKAPETGYAVDDSIQAIDMATFEYHPEAASSVLETWGTFTDEMPPILEPGNKVFVVKTAEGNYAKIIIMNYYGTDGSGYITFKYMYQPDGSTKLE